MPIGVFTNMCAVIFGGIFGTFFGSKFSEAFKENMNMIFGVSSIGIGIASVVLMENMPVVVFSIILGTALGLAIHLGERINAAGLLLQKFICKFVKPKGNLPEEEFSALLITAIVLFCASGTGIYGALVSGMTGDHSILLAKSILDIFTSLIFACSLGLVVSLIAIPQGMVFLLLFFAAGLIYPLTTATMINDFKACGGIIMVATGFRLMKTKAFPIADMIPAMVLVMPLSWAWVTYILPLVNG